MTTANLRKRLEALQDSKGGDCRIAYVRDSEEAERLYGESLGAGRVIPLIIVTDASQSPAVIDGGTVREDDGPGCKGRAPHSRPGRTPGDQLPHHDHFVWRAPHPDQAA